jgi:hypothetical protein
MLAELLVVDADPSILGGEGNTTSSACRSIPASPIPSC